MMKAIALVCALGLAATFAIAQQPKERQGSSADREQIRRLQSQTSTLTQERDKLNAERSEIEQKLKQAEARSENSRRAAAGSIQGVSKLRAELSASRDEIEKSKVERARVQSELDQETMRRADLDKQLAGLKEQLTQTIAQQKITAGGLAEREAQAKLQSSAIAERGRRLSACEASSQALEKIAIAAVADMESISGLRALRIAEPFSGRGRAELEQLSQDYRDRIAKARVAPQ